MDSLVTTAWLAEEIGACDLRIIDATKHLHGAGRNAFAEYEEGHIPGAVFMDLENLVDHASPVENSMPNAKEFAARMAALGIGDGSRIVLYDDSAVKTSARAWFMLRMFGAQNVAILDGGIARWRAEGRPVTAGRQERRQRHFTPWSDASQLRSKEQMLANIASQSEQVLDARSAARFSGNVPESRPAMASGHIPGSINLPYTVLYNPDGTFKDVSGLREAFTATGVDFSRPVVTTCGSGVTACVLTFGMHLLGKEDVALYDGSWSEWGCDPATPKSVGEALAA
ncbi:MAG: 3-mercaptopyruvate sulfurtransferase [Sphingomonadales bacterium]|nr:3-mercaptopyruvate sulfurtransferase [Sphingomonadales bacterium]MBU3993359.1 3-mercaptopyruvate sulfurtransferase [Alphaproteobacteria bacterium]